MRKKILSFVICLFLLPIFTVSFGQPGGASAAPLLNAYDVIEAINAYRANNGLYSYQTNSTLMGTAQDQANQMAATGQITHTGAGGTTPFQRAAAAGYGGGQHFFISEIIYGGTNATVETAMTWWLNSGPHYTAITSPNYQEIGAGVASAGGWTYYAAVMAYVVGGEIRTPPPDDGGGGIGSVPVVASTAGPDGSIIHVVQQGQSLWTISAVYGVPLDEILALNGLTENSLIFPGDEIIIRAAFTATPSPEAEASATATPIDTATITPTKDSRTSVAIAVPTRATGEEVKSTTADEGAQDKVTFSDPAIIILMLAFVILVGVIVMGSVRGKEVEG